MVGAGLAGDGRVVRWSILIGNCVVRGLAGRVNVHTQCYPRLMAKTRMTFTIDPADAERLRRAAQQAGVTVSAYIERRVLDSVEQDEAIRKTFADADAATNAAYVAADAAIWPDPEPLSSERKAELDAVLDRFFDKFPRGA